MRAPISVFINYVIYITLKMFMSPEQTKQLAYSEVYGNYSSNIGNNFVNRIKNGIFRLKVSKISSRSFKNNISICFVFVIPISFFLKYTYIFIHTQNVFIDLYFFLFLILFIYNLYEKNLCFFYGKCFFDCYTTIILIHKTVSYIWK